MQTISKETMEFPIVIKRVVDQIILSVPDLAIYKYLNFSEINMNPENSSISAKLGKEIEKLWIDIENHRETRKWQPIPSTFKQSLEKPQEDFSLPEFVKKLNQYMSISENTIRREIQRGVIRCYQTEGHHRRIPSSEIASYLNYCENKRKPKEI